MKYAQTSDPQISGIGRKELANAIYSWSQLSRTTTTSDPNAGRPVL